MKLRFPLLLAAAFMAASFLSSCTLVYICQCTIKYSFEPGLSDYTIREYEIRDTKKKAKSLCEANSGTWQTGNIITVETCEIY